MLIATLYFFPFVVVVCESPPVDCVCFTSYNRDPFRRVVIVGSEGDNFGGAGVDVDEFNAHCKTLKVLFVVCFYYTIVIGFVKRYLE